jgi:quercetin dioxygenase-like cupin family protein
MIRRLQEQRVERVEKPHDGEGAIEMRYIVEAENHKNRHLKTMARVTVRPGDAVGYHTHEGVTEIITILEGRALYFDGAERILEPGDAAVVSGSEGQSIRCADDQPMTYLAVILVP